MRLIDADALLEAVNKIFEVGDNEHVDDVIYLITKAPTVELYTKPPQPQSVRDALEKAAKIARDACLTLPDGGSPSDETIEACNCAEKAILALIKKD